MRPYSSSGHGSTFALHLAVRLASPRDPEKRIAIIQLPRMSPRWIQVSGSAVARFVLLEDLVRMHLAELFPGYEVEESVSFRVTRDGDAATDDQEAEDLVDAVRQMLKSRLRGDPVRLEIEEAAGDAIVNRLVEGLGIEPVMTRGTVALQRRAAKVKGSERTA